MSLGPRLDLRQSQQLVMTPQLQQAIKLLALSNLEVEGFIAEEIERNPLLDTGGDDRGDNGGDRDAPVEADPASDAPDWEPEPMGADQLVAGADPSADAPLDMDYGAETFHHDAAIDQPGGPGLDGGLSSGGDGGTGGEAPDLDTLAAAALTLHEHLMAQAGSSLTGIDLLIAEHLIDQIDEAGYLSADLIDLSHRLHVPPARIDAVLAHVQTFEPTGVGARDLAECLALQAKEADRYDPCMARLIANLDLLARGALPQLRRLCGVDEEDMADMIRELRAYDPKPGLRIGGAAAAAVVPDLFIARTRTGWAIELNQSTLPRVLVNRSYYAELSSGPQDRTSKAWLADCLASANWLVKALDQRARTILKVATELARQQEAFFRDGVEHLKPLTLRTVAEAIGMHESTVSRVTSNKYLSCERGLFELKYFFTSGISGAEGEGVSAEAVKSHIARLIADEAPGAILSDDALVDLLKAKGFDIARRTVAKYREAIGLGSSVQRRRQKAIQGARAA